MEQNERRFAVLIDTDNVSPKYIKYILDEVSDIGIATYKRIYGDWTDNEKKSWKNVLRAGLMVIITAFMRRAVVIRRRHLLLQRKK